MQLESTFGLLTILILAIVHPFLIECQRSSSRGRKECTVQELQKCTQFLQSVTENSDSALPANREELKAICDDLRVGVKCLDKHMQLCFTHEQTMVYKDLVSPAREFISQLCDTATIQREFLKHASCYRNISLDVDKCANKYKEAVRISSQATGSATVNPDLTMKLSCCALREFVNCKYYHVSLDCGKEAEMFMRNHLGQITNPIMDRHCSAYTYGSEACKLSLEEASIESAATATAIEVSKVATGNSSSFTGSLFCLFFTLSIIHILPFTSLF